MGWGEVDARLEGVVAFWYMVTPLDQTGDYWLSVQGNIMHARSVWKILGTLLRQEGAEPRVAAMFYWAVVQVILLYGSEMWVLSDTMENKVEESHTCFLR